MTMPEQTGDLTGPNPNPVNPAPLTQSPILPPLPSSSPSSDALAQYEQRVRALMSEKDRTRHQYEQAVAERLEIQRKYDELATTHQSTVQGATQNIEQALNRAKQLEAEAQKLAGENAKLKKLGQHPDLLPYMALIPATTDEAALDAAIQNLIQVRQQDIEKALAARAPQAPQAPQNQPPADPYASLRAAYPNQQVPPAAPARPAPTSIGTDSLMALEQELASKADEAMRDGNLEAFERFLEQKTQAEAARLRQTGFAG